nr:reverse transcriptase domain, reverse transcriptase zinc-binding domain protein [Tanacetum cinerariifolium]
MLNQGDYEMCRRKIEQYFQVQDYALWDVIENDNSFKPVAQTTTNDADTMSIDDLYNNFKIVEQEVKGTTSTNSSSQNIAFVSSSSPNSTNEVPTGYEVSTASTQSNTASTQVSTANLSDATVPVNNALLKTTVYCVRPMLHFSKSAQSTVKRPYQQRIAFTNKSFRQTVNIARPRPVNTARPRPVNTVRLRPVNAARPNSTAVNAVRVITANDEVVTTADVEVSAALTTTKTTDHELTLAQNLIEIKAAKPKAITTATTTVTAIKKKGIIMKEPSKTPSPKPIVSSQQPSQPKDKGKAKMVEPKRPLKRKEQIMMDEQIARDLEAQIQADIEEEQRIGKQKEEEANIAMILDENVQAEVADDDTAELKRCLEIVPEDDDDVTIKATPLSFKSPTIVDYKIYKEGKKSYFKIIRADGNSQNYLTFGTMFKNFNREDLEVLRSIIKTRFKKTKPVNVMDNLLFQTLKTMFEHHVKDSIWKHQQGAVKVHNWKIFDSCGVYCVTTQNMVYYLLVEKMYPFTNNILHQLWKDVRLHVDYKVEMAYDLFRLIRRQINEGYIPA